MGYMFTFARLRKSPRLFESLTGLTVQEFERLLADIEDVMTAARHTRLSVRRPKRQRTFGAGREYALPFSERVLLALVFLRHYLTCMLLGCCFDVDAATAWRNVHEMLPFLSGDGTYIAVRRGGGRKASPWFHRPGQKPVGTLEELQQRIPGLEEILSDATEQKTKRPQDGRKRRPLHSGKQRAFTLKTQLSTTKHGLILHVSRAVGGRMSDLTLLRSTTIPKDLEGQTHLSWYLDMGYQGIAHNVPEANIHMPRRRTPGRKVLTRDDRRHNHTVRKTRIFVEHAIAKLKGFRVLKETYRHARTTYSTAFRAVAGLVNFRTLLRQAATV